MIKLLKLHGLRSGPSVRSQVHTPIDRFQGHGRGSRPAETVGTLEH
jgi:hypothetical protein